jgi:hypothetical protein
MPQVLQLIRAGVVEPTRNHGDAVDLRGPIRHERVEPASELAAAELLYLRRQPIALVLQFGDGVRQGRLQRAELTARPNQLVELRLDVLQSGRSGHGLHPTHPRGDRPLGQEAKQPNLAGGLDVRTPAELHAEIGVERNDANLLAVLLVEEGHRAAVEGLVNGHLALLPFRDVALNGRIDPMLHVPERRFVDGIEVAEVEPQAVRGHERSLLLHVIAQRVAEHGVHQMGRGVVRANATATLRVHLGPHRAA